MGTQFGLVPGGVRKHYISHMQAFEKAPFVASSSSPSPSEFCVLGRVLENNEGANSIRSNPFPSVLLHASPLPVSGTAPESFFLLDSLLRLESN